MTKLTDDAYRKAIEKGERFILQALPCMSLRDVVEQLGISDKELVRTAIILEDNSERVCPSFQFDLVNRRVHPVVGYANQILSSVSDQFDTAAWWITSTDTIDGSTPLDLLDKGELTEDLVDTVIHFSQQGM
ncbi:hypothetical protein IEU95_08605 [Hoyosella rhizosphaerae]|uniref:Uncharacterized protein n=1 Tax=Hoyosella rhizosphaerae TaxID=1755582 RepID=A0A916U0H4_9ACTN|nr:hypothetical protein [Hoyosella rhizosphaerae]MBN4926889.1 hypothetical protein [Hoyosella rhizosphaerae]GGC55725.1 hypothetical protein GCM10011410_05150 [Hoyosella rhizosphaerae]